jgi:transposase-like protein
MSLLDRKYFKDEKSAFAHLEAILWADGVVCPHCGTVDQAGRLNGVKDKAGRVRPGLWKCYSKGCRKQFTVKVGTVFQCAHIPLHKMLQAVHLICSSKKGISAHQLHRTLEVDYKSAWFLAHRIREAMRTGSLAPMGGTGGVIEVDETYIGRRQGTPAVRNIRDKNMVMTLVERGGSARSFHLDGMAISDIMPILRENVARESRVNTDEAKSYYDIGKEYAGHDTVNHGREEYVRYTRDPKYIITTNTVEGYYSIFKRGMKGV